VDDVSSVSEVSDNDTDDDSEPMSTNTCSDCHATSELTALCLVISKLQSVCWHEGSATSLPLVLHERLKPVGYFPCLGSPIFNVYH